MASKVTPMLAQYKSIKAQYPDVILMFRLGDFYEMFGDDAVTAARELEIVLTSRDAGAAGKMPMCGVPYHSVERYVARLISRGYRVAICDQLEDAKLAKGLVKRDVTRVVTPGTLLEDGMLDAKSNNYLLALVPGEDAAGIAVVDISTGEFAVTEVEGRDCVSRALEEVARLTPAETLLREIDQDLEEPVRNASRGYVTRYEDDRSFVQSAREQLREHFGTTSLRGFGCEDMTVGPEAAAMVINYLKRTNAATLQHVTSISTYSTAGFMVLDPPARRNLEIVQSMSPDGKGKSLLSILDRTKTAMGGRLIRKWLDQPLLDVPSITLRQEAVEELYRDSLLRGELRDVLSEVQDMERLMSRIVIGNANALDMVGLAVSLEALPQLQAALSAAESPMLKQLTGEIDSLEHVTGLIRAAIADDPPANLRDGGIMRSGFNDELDRLRTAATSGRDWIANLEASERERTGIKNLKVGYNSVFGYYIEVSKPNLKYVPDDYIRKQTTVNGERFITPELKEWEARVLGADEKAVELEYKLFGEVREKVADEARSVGRVARAVAELDVLASLAEVAALNGYIRPVVDDSEEILIKNGRHPVVEQFLVEERFVPNDSLLNCETDQLLIITGPNMAGKSTYLRQVALIALMAQVGGFVPADEARIGVVDRVFTRVGAHDELASGQSTFMVEMNETASILNNATRRSLIVLDEIGRGTSTYDGLSIAWAVAERIKEIGAKTLFATHYHHLNELEKQMPGVKNYRIAVKEEADRIVWLRKIMPGGTDRSYGIEVARLAGLPKEVIDRAAAILADLENNGSGGKLVDKKKSVSARTKKLQLTLFEAERHPVIDELEKLDISTLSPVEALVKLDELQ
ncbi:MAG: DNA mismatch repair protein MutS, partial [Armatimonadetes bacterium]|nr:DNA mismatch repair protein MutS [Armatimonadota bacterium]